MAKTKKPTGVKIARDGATNKFTVSWNHGQKKYTDQEMIWYEVYKKTTDSDASKRYETSHKVDLTKGAKSKQFSITWNDYAPTGTKRLCSLKVKLRAKSSSGWSDWTKRVTFDVQTPRAPTFNADQKPAPLKNANTATYTWNVYDAGGKQMYNWSHYQVVEMPNFSGTTLDEVSWSSARRVYEGYLPYSTIAPYNTYDAVMSLLPSGSNTKTQFFRVRTYGPQGFSGWAENWHVFGIASEAKNVGVTVKRTHDGGYLVTVNWTLAASKYKKPSDEVVVRHTYAVPKVTKTTTTNGATFTLSCQTSPAPSWTAHSSLTDTKLADQFAFTLDSRLSDDEVFFVQVNNLHDTEDTTNYGQIIAAKIGDTYGTLATPVLSSSDYVPASHLATITVSRETEVPNSYTAIYVKRGDAEPSILGIIPYGQSSTTIAVPSDIDASEELKFGVRNLLADYTYSTSDGVTTYTIGTIYMSSGTEWSGGAIASPPTVALSNPDPGTILVEWDWAWAEAQSAELSWSTDKYAWESTEGPSTYVISNNHAGKWRIPNLDYDKYYVRVRLIKSGDDYETYGLYSDEDNFIELTAEAPPVPNLTIEPSVIAPGSEINCYWQYAAEDGSSQLQANIYEAYVDGSGNITYDETPLAVTSVGQHLTIDTSQLLEWTSANSPRYLAMETISSYGTKSEKSGIASVQIVAPLEVSLSLGTGFSSTTEDDTTYNWLTQFPFTVNVTGVDYDGSTSLYIRRTTSYLIERPDGDTSQGFEGETVFVATLENESSVTVEADDQRIIGSFDDGVRYDMVLVSSDKYGQSASATATFTIDWDHKATLPSAEIIMDYVNSVAYLTPQQYPEMDFYISGDNVYVEAEEVDTEDIGDMAFSFSSDGHLIYTYENAYADFELSDGDLYVTSQALPGTTGDVCDIYRLTADKPEIVFEGAAFGTTYVDPYPTLGKVGGYRFVYRTLYNDNRTGEGVPAWTDYGWADGATLDLFDTIIDFDGYQLHIPFNLDISHKWEKDFTETKYLGGAIQGDWNPAVSHTLSVSTEVAVEYFSETAQLLRILARYPGVCHIRTPDGSSFSANIEVGEDRGDKMIAQLAKFSLDITRVDQETPDGMTYTDWIAE